MADQIEKVLVPDIGGAEDVDVIEVFVAPGDSINEDDSIITLESEKASMEVPSPQAGVVESVALKVGDKVSEGSLILTLKAAAGAAAKTETAEKKEEAPAPKAEAPKLAPKVEPEVEAVPAAAASAELHAGPAVRRLAHELDIDLSKIKGTGEKGRILKGDLKNYLSRQGGGGAGGGFSLPSAPQVDFSKYGDIETKPLTKIQKFSGGNLHRNWISIPHITQFEEADITELEAFRQEQKAHAAKQGFKLTPLVFIMKAVVAALKQFPGFNASLDANGENLILKKYFHLGVAVDTPDGLVVPVIRDVDKKGLYELAAELGEVSARAREGGLKLNEMQGGCFTISSLGGIGGTAFTPIINAPEVAILGVSKMIKRPVYQTYGEFVPRLMLPLSLSYDHRVIDGAEGARFVVYLANRLSDIRTLLL